MSAYSRKRKSGSAPMVAGKKRLVYRAQPSVPRLLRPSGELKGVDTLLTQTPILDTTNTNTGIVVVNLVVPGNGSYNRVGRKIRMRSLRLVGNIDAQCTYQAISTTMSGGTARMVVVYDKQPSGVLPTFDTIFGLTQPDGTESSTYLANIRYDNTERFTVLRDVVINCNPEGMVATGGVIISPQYKFDEYIRLNLDTVYSGQSSPQTIADISSGALYVCFRVDQNASGVFTATVPSSSFARLRYVDN